MKIQELHDEKTGKRLVLNVAKQDALRLSQRNPRRFEQVLDAFCGYSSDTIERTWTITRDELRVYVKAKRTAEKRILFAYSWCISPRFFNPMTELEICRTSTGFEKQCWLDEGEMPIQCLTGDPWRVIASYLDVEDLFALRAVSRSVSGYVSTAAIWTPILSQISRNLPPRFVCAFATLPPHVRVARFLLRVSSEAALIAALKATGGQIYATVRGEEVYEFSRLTVGHASKRQRAAVAHPCVVNYRSTPRMSATLAIGIYSDISRGVIASMWIDDAGNLMTFIDGRHEPGINHAQKKLHIYRRLLLYGNLQYK